MKRNFLKVVSISLCALIVLASVGGFAAEVSTDKELKITFSEINSEEVTLKGSFGKADRNRMAAILVLSEDKEIGELGNITVETVEHVGQTRVNNTGEWSYTFILKGESGNYRFSATCEGKKLIKERTVLNDEDLNNFIEDLISGLLSAEEITSFMELYGACFGIDMSIYDSDERLSVLVEDIINGIDIIEESGKEGINQIEKISYKKAEILKVIETAVYVNDIHNILEKNNDVINIDFTDYNSLSGSQRREVLSELQGDVFDDMEAVKKEFNKQVEIRMDDDDSGSGSSGGRGGSGSSGRGGNSGDGTFTQGSIHNETNDIVDNSTTLFSDIHEAEWAQQAIEYLAEKGVISGYEDGSFKPNNSVTREEFVKMVVMAFGLLKDNAKADFEDVQETQWFYPYVASAYEQGIISGISEIRFGTGKEIIRQDIAVILYRIIGADKLAEMKQIEQSFTDAEKISDYAVDAVEALAGAGIINGMGDGCFAPKNSATRAEVAKLIYEALIR